jgi:hypothetical protein
MPLRRFWVIASLFDPGGKRSVDPCEELQRCGWDQMEAPLGLDETASVQEKSRTVLTVRGASVGVIT